MHRSELGELAITPVAADADLEAMVGIRRRVNPAVHPRVDNLRHALDSAPTLTFLLARLDGEPVGCGFVESTAAHYAAADFEVVPEVRRRGVGTALLAELSARAAALGKTALQLEVRESELAAIAFLEHRGYERVGAEPAVSLDLTAVDELRVEPPPGVRIVSRAEQPGLLEELYAVALEAERDVPGTAGDRPFRRMASRAGTAEPAARILRDRAGRRRADRLCGAARFR